MEPVVSEREKARKAADAAFRVLEDRKGFDWWWEDLDEDLQEEIREAVTEAIWNEVSP